MSGEFLIAGMDLRRLPAHLDGRQGSNRRRDAPNQLGADNDLDAVRCFLREYQAAPATQRAYRKEAERLLLWAVIERRRPLSSLTREDLEAYGAFLAAPGPAWCAPRGGRARGRYSSAWRPFCGPLSPSAIRTALRIVNSLFHYLVQAGYLRGNPLALLRQKAPMAADEAARRRVGERCFSAAQWEALLETLEALPTGSPLDRAWAERARFWVALLHFLALRIGEAAAHRMGSFEERRGRWHFRVVGKGRKEALLPVNAALLSALRRYRDHLGLPPLPPPGDETPLLADLTGQAPITGRRAHQVLKRLLGLAADRLAASDPEEAARLRRGSPHWFRHTALTRQWEKGIPLPQIRANARHARLDTTMLYVHTEEEERHREIEKLTWK